MNRHKRPLAERASRQESGHERRSPFLNVDEAAELLQTTRRAIYAMVERRQLPGVVRLRRRVLFHSHVQPDWLDQKRASSPEEQMAMSVNIRQHPRDGRDVDISVLLTTGIGIANGAR